VTVQKAKRNWSIRYTKDNKCTISLAIRLQYSTWHSVVVSCNTGSTGAKQEPGTCTCANTVYQALLSQLLMCMVRVSEHENSVHITIAGQVHIHTIGIPNNITVYHLILAGTGVCMCVSLICPPI
jgi:hypothetical protein